jgi:hypothetical protein
VLRCSLLLLPLLPLLLLLLAAAGPGAPLGRPLRERKRARAALAG